MLNYKFSSLLEDTPLTAEDKYNLSVIFVAMKSERQLDIIECWPTYLERIVQLHTEAENAKKLQLQETFSKINQIISTAKLKKGQPKNTKKNKKTQNTSLDPLALI